MYKFKISGPVTLTPTGFTYVTLYFDNITMTGLDQVFYLDLVQTDPESSINVQTTRSSVTLQPIGMPCVVLCCASLKYGK